MNRGRLLASSSIVLFVIVGSACGASQPSSSSSPPNTTPKRLVLAPAGDRAEPAVDRAAPALYPLRPTRYVLDAPLADLGATAPVRRMQARPVSGADVQRFADALGLAAAPVRTPTGWAVQTADSILNVDLSAGTARISYSVGGPTSVGGATGSGSSGPEIPTTGSGGVVTPNSKNVNNSPVDVPSAADAQSIAHTLLDRMDALAGQDWSIAVDDSGGTAIACPVGVPCPAVPPQVSARTVTFSLVVDGEDVDGVDWSVTIGERGRVESVDGEWSSPTTVGAYPLRPTAAVFADVRQGDAHFPGPQPLIAEEIPLGADRSTVAPPVEPAAVVVHISGVGLGVARWDEFTNSGTIVDLVPTYRFRARVDGGAAYDIVTLALEPSAVTFAEPAPAPKPLPANGPG